MNNKNLILTVLACLNCVHTTHAVESTSNNETVDQLRVRWALQEERSDQACKKKDPVVARDALGQVAENRRKIVKLTKDGLNPANPNWHIAGALEKGMGKMRDHIQSLTDTDLAKYHHRHLDKMIEAKIRKLTKKRQIPGVDVASVRHNLKQYPSQGYPYTNALCKAYPDLDKCVNGAVQLPESMFLFCLLNTQALKNATDFDNQMNALADLCSDTAKKRLDGEKNQWANDLIRFIKSDSSIVHNLSTKIKRLGTSETKIAQEATNTILETISNIVVSGADPYLMEKTATLFLNDPDLRAMVMQRVIIS